MSGGFVSVDERGLSIRDLSGRIHEFAFEEVKKVSLQQERGLNQMQFAVLGVGFGALTLSLFKSAPKHPADLFVLGVGLVVGGLILGFRHPHKTVYQAC